MIEDAGGSNDDATVDSFICLQAYVEDLDQSADDALSPLQDQYDQIAFIVSSIEQEVAESQTMEQAA